MVGFGNSTRIKNGEGHELKIWSSGSITTTDEVHYRIKNSKEWFGGYQWIDAANASVKYFRIKTGAKSAHGVLYVEIDGKVLMEFYEGATINASGTSISSKSLNRETITNPITELFYDCTTTDDGTKLGGKVVGVSSTSGPFGVNASGGLVDGAYWMLAPNTEYVLKITNQAGETTNILVQYEWHEHEAI